MVVMQIITTTATADDARRIARELVERRLAACVQIVGRIKTRGDLFGRVEQAILELHPYELPEILTLTADASKAYLDWLRRETDVI